MCHKYHTVVQSVAQSVAHDQAKIGYISGTMFYLLHIFLLAPAKCFCLADCQYVSSILFAMALKDLIRVPQKCGNRKQVPQVPQMWYTCGTKVGPILDFFNLADRGIPEESLPKEYKEAKDLYVKNNPGTIFSLVD
jgi:hypothetical protein